LKACEIGNVEVVPRGANPKFLEKEIMPESLKELNMGALAETPTLKKV
jgi:hypothetical protein